jgi:hypothetical protein
VYFALINITLRPSTLVILYPLIQNGIFLSGQRDSYLYIHFSAFIILYFPPSSKLPYAGPTGHSLPPFPHPHPSPPLFLSPEIPHPGASRSPRLLHRAGAGEPGRPRSRLRRFRPRLQRGSPPFGTDRAGRQGGPSSRAPPHAPAPWPAGGGADCGASCGGSRSISGAPPSSS